MSARNPFGRIAGIVLVGTHPWTNSAFDKLAPRPLLPVAHRPLLSYALHWLRDGGVRDAVVCANRETQVLESRLHRHVPLGMTVSYQEDSMPRGAAGAVKDAADASDATVFVIADGTAIPNVDLADLLQAHHASRAAVTVVVHSEAERLVGKPSTPVPSGVYVFNRQVLDHVPASGFYDIKETLIPQLHRAGERISPYSISTPSPRVLDASSYLAVNEWMVEHLVAAGARPEGYLKSGSSLFHRDAVIAPGAMFVGPVLVGPGAEIKSGAVIVGPTSIGREASIGSGVLISRSAIWRRCMVNENAVTDRCIVGDDAVVPAGTQAFRQVRLAPVSYEPAFDRGIAQEPESAAPELLKRMSRALLGTTWSRFPAAQ